MTWASLPQTKWKGRAGIWGRTDIHMHAVTCVWLHTLADTHTPTHMHALMHTHKIRRQTKDICHVWLLQKLVDSKHLARHDAFPSTENEHHCCCYCSWYKLEGTLSVEHRLRGRGCNSVLESKASMLEALGLTSHPPKHIKQGII